jgi:hypothetical protein
MGKGRRWPLYLALPASILVQPRRVLTSTLSDGGPIDAPIFCNISILDHSAIVPHHHPGRITHLRRCQVLIFCLAQEIAAKTVSHRVMRPRINACAVSQTAQPFRENINILIRRYRPLSPSVGCKPIKQIVSNVHKPPLARFGFDAFDFDCPILQINFRPIKGEELRSSKSGE